MNEEKIEIIRSNRISYGFDPKFQERLVDYYQSFIKDPINEIRKLKDDPVKFIEFNCMTMSKDPLTGRQIKIFMELMPHQKRFIEQVHNEVFLDQRNCVLLKSRQQGASWMLCFYALFVSIFYSDDMQNIIMTTIKEEDLYRPKNPFSLMGKVEFALDNLPRRFIEETGLIYEPSTSNKQILVGKSIISGALGKNPARSQTALLMIHDEFDAHDNQDDFLRAVLPACSMNIFTSTLNRRGSRFDSMTKSKEYVQLRLSWEDDLRIGSSKEEKKKFRQKIINESSIESFNKEYAMKHSENDNSYLVDKIYLKKQRELIITEEIKQQYSSYPVVAGMDCAGFGKDNYVIIIRKGPLELACIKFGTNDEDNPVPDTFDQYEKLTKRKVYTKYILPAYRMFGFQILAYDVIGVGHAFADFFLDLENQGIQIPFIHYPLILSSSGMDSENQLIDDATELNSQLIYLNLRSRLFWKYKTRLEKTIDGTAEPMETLFVQNEEVLEELQFITYNQDKKIQIVSKKELRKDLEKIGRSSPDCIDADVYTGYAQELYLEKISDETYFQIQARNLQRGNKRY